MVRVLRRLAPDFWLILLLFVLPLGFFFPQTLGGRTLIPAENLYQYEPWASYRDVVNAPDTPHNHLVSDLVLQNYQWKAFIREQLAAGEVPLWNPHQFSGIPFLAAGQHSALYPLSVIYYGLPLHNAYGWFTVVNLWLAGVFMYLFVRGLGVGRAGAVLAGIIYQFAGFTIASVVFQMMIGGLPWLPLMLLMVEYIIREKPVFGRKTAIPWVVIGAGALGMNVLAGHVEITIYTLLITGYYTLAHWLHDWWFKNRQTPLAALRKCFWCGAMLALGMGLAAVQFLPLYEFAQTNWRAERSSYETVVSYAHPPRDILQFALPNFYGSPAHHRVFDVFSGEWVAEWDNANNQNHTEWGIKNYVEGALYLGILPLLLAAYAMIDRLLIWGTAWRNNERIRTEPPYRRAFTLLALLSLTFMFGLPTYRLMYILPGINQLNSPFRWVFALTVSVAVLAAFGLDALQRRAAEKRSLLETRIGLGIMGLALMVFAGLAASRVFYPQIEPQIERLLNSLALATNAFSDPALFYSYQFANILVFGGMLLGAGFVYFWVGRMRMYRGVWFWSAFAVLLVTADLMIASGGFNPASDPALLDFTPPQIEWLQERYEEDGAFRYTTLESPGSVPILNANSTLRYGLDDVRGYDSIIPAQYMEYMSLLAPQVQRDFNRVAPIFTDDDYNHSGGYAMLLDSPLLHLLNVRYVVTTPDVIVPFEEWEAVCCEEVLTIWENPDALPRASIIAAGDMPQGWLPPESAAPDFHARDAIPPYEAITVTQDTGREKFLDVQASEGDWLFYSENYAPGWKAFVRPMGAGEEQESQLEVVRVAGTFMGVQLPEGDWTLRLVYSPTSFQVGFFGSVISAALLTLLLGIWFWITYVGVNTDESSQTARVARNSIAPIILNLFNRAIDFVLAFVLYRLLTQEMVGVYQFAVVVFVWFDIFTNFGLDLFLIREVSRDKGRGGYFLYNSSALRFALSGAGLGILLVFLLLWQNAVANPLPQEGLIAIVILYLGLIPGTLNKGISSLYYAHEQADKTEAIATLTTINKAIFSVIVLVLGWGIIGLAAVSILNNIFTMIALLWMGRGFFAGNLPKRPDWHSMRGMMREGWPLLLNHFLATIFFQIDIVILQAMRGATIVAEYSTAYKWLAALNVVPAFFTRALFPVLSRQGQEDRAAFRRSYRFGIKLMISLALPVAVGFTVLAEPLTLLLAGARYLPNGAIALTIMIWSIPIGWMNSLTQYALVALDLQRMITRAFIAAVAFNIITNLIFIPQFGFRAAAVTTIFSELVLWIPFAALMQRGLGAPLGWIGLLWRPVVATGAMIATAVLLLPVNMLLALIVASLVYVVVLLALNPLDADERAILLPLLPQRLRGFPFMRTA